MQCPKCGSTRYQTNSGGAKCSNCGENFPLNAGPPPFSSPPAFSPKFAAPAPPKWNTARDIKWQVAIKCATELCIAEKNYSVEQVELKAIELLKALVKEPDTTVQTVSGNPNTDQSINPQPPEQNYREPLPITPPGTPQDDRGFQQKQDGIDAVNRLTSDCDTHSNWAVAEQKLHDSKPHPIDVIYFEQCHQLWIEGQEQIFNQAV